MKKFWLTGIALAAGLSLSATAHAQVRMGIAGPVTGPAAAFGAQLKNGAEQAIEDINAAGGILGQKIQVFIGDDASRPEAGRVGGQQVRRRRREVRRRPLQLRRLDPRLRSLQRERHPADHAGLHEPDVHRTQAVEHVPHLRARRPAGRGGRQAHRREAEGQEGRGDPRQDALRQGPRRRNQEDDEFARREGSHLRRHQCRREGLFGADHALPPAGRGSRDVRRIAHGSGPHRAPDARRGRQRHSRGRRRHHLRRIRLHRGRRGPGHAHELRPRSDASARARPTW